MTTRELSDRRKMCLGIWTMARYESDTEIDDAWADDAIRAADALLRRETWAITGAALGQEMTVGDCKRAARHAHRSGSYTAPGLEDRLGDDDGAEALKRWRAATVHRWLTLGDLIQRRRRNGNNVSTAWLARVRVRGNPRNEDLDANNPEPPPPLEPIAEAPGDVRVFEVHVDNEGPTQALPPGARWYPDHRTVSLVTEAGHLLVTGPGAANAVRSGPGTGNAIRSGPGHGYAVRRGGDGDAVREGAGHGYALRDIEGEGTATRSGRGHGSAQCNSGGDSGAVRSGSGHGSACCPYGRLGALRSGSGKGNALYGAGPGRRTGTGDGAEIDVKAILDRVREKHDLGTDTPADPTLLNAVADRPPEPAAGPEPEPRRPICKVRVLRNGEQRVPKRAGIRYDERTHTLILDTDTDGSIMVMGRGHINVERTGAGHGDAIRTDSGHGNVRRSGTGDGNAVRTGSGYGDAVRSGTGKGEAFVGDEACGEARRTQHHAAGDPP